MNPKVIANFACFQAAWFGCVFLTASGRPLLGAACPALAVGVHAWSYRTAIARESRLIAKVTSLGLVLDLIAVRLGLLALPADASFVITALWFAALWAGFATLLNSSMSWLQGRPVLAAMLGAIAGPLSYWAGVRMGSLVVNHQPWGWVWVAAEWAIAMPIVVTLAKRSKDHAA